MKHFSAVIFDMDGLLLDTERLSFEVFQTLCNDLNLGDLSDLFRQCIGTTAEQETAILKKGLAGITDYEDFILAWHQGYKKRINAAPIPLKQGVEEVLEYLQAIKMPLAIATSTRTDSAKEKLKSSNILQYFDIIIGGDQVKNSKPNPEIYLKAAMQIGVNPTQCLAFEDSDNGVKAALSAGITVVQIPDLVEPSQELKKLGHIILPQITDVLDYKF